MKSYWCHIDMMHPQVKMQRLEQIRPRLGVGGHLPQPAGLHTRAGDITPLLLHMLTRWQTLMPCPLTILTYWFQSMLHSADKSSEWLTFQWIIKRQRNRHQVEADIDYLKYCQWTKHKFWFDRSWSGLFEFVLKWILPKTSKDTQGNSR